MSGWQAVHAFVAGLSLPTPLPEAGSPEWAEADEDTRTASLVVAGSRWVLEGELAELEARRIAAKDAAVAISQAKDWARVADEIRWRSANPWVERIAA